MEAVMKKSLLTVAILGLLAQTGFAIGVGIIDAHNAVYLRLDSTNVRVSVLSQISITTTTQYFTNTGAAAKVKYGFPLSESASATQLRWTIGGNWYVAGVSGTSQDTTLPGEGTPDQNLLTYLGSTPLYFSIPDTVQADSSIAVELTYVELLPYAFGSVDYSYPADYHLIQSSQIDVQRFDFRISSPRTIDSIKVISSQPVDLLTNFGDSAEVEIVLHESPATANYQVRYSLNAHELGLFAFSTLLPDTLVPDSLGRGFLTFIAEPDPGETTETISKVFTLIIDRSGSMGESNKMDQAKDAATYIVNNLNEGDRFNLIDFDDVVSSFRPGHVLYTPQTRDSALAYISSLYSRNLTSISGAFSTAVPQFASANDSTANIIIFLTDGIPTAGITDIGMLVKYVDSLITGTETNINLFCFGIGGDVNYQLLSLLASNNRGFAYFLGNDEVYSSVTDFYATIRNPVLLDSHISVDPPAITEIYPDSLPNLYKGKQMIVAGRYSSAQPVAITLSGKSLGHPVSYTYDIDLSDSQVTNYQFIPKVWAKQKIETLLISYYTMDQASEAANALKNEIIAISQAYGIVTEFTSFQGNSGGGTGVVEVKSATPPASGASMFELIGNYPNPFNPSTTIRMKLNRNYSGNVELRIYNILGQVVRILHLHVNGPGIYNFFWDGLGQNGSVLTSGVYLYAVNIGNTVLVGKMILMK